MFALTNFQTFESISLKCVPDDAVALCGAFPAVTPGYHLNKRHWITVVLDGSVPDHLLRRWIRDSYSLVVKGMPGENGKP
jgi:predicted DNA-binding protein (MmcQ/YjbR family)